MKKFSKNSKGIKQGNNTNKKLFSNAVLKQSEPDSLFIGNVGDLGQGQLSFFRFLTQGLKDEIATVNNPILIKKDCASKHEIHQESAKFNRVYFYPADIKIKLPSKSPYAAAKANGTYSAQVYALVEYWTLLDWNQLSLNADLFNQISVRPHLLPAEKKETENFSCEKHYLCIAEIPFITEEGSFMINGCERVIISQIIRSPGIYFKKERVKVTPSEARPFYKLAYTGTIISASGRWAKIYLDVQASFSSHGIPCNDSPYIRRPFIEDALEECNALVDETAQDWSKDASFKDLRESDDTFLYLYAALSKFGLANLEIRDLLKYPQHYENEYLKCRDYQRYHRLQFFENSEDKKKEDKQYPLPGSRASLMKEIESFYSPEGSQKFAIGKIGRARVNMRLNVSLPEIATFLTVHDLAAIINILLDFRYLTPKPQEDDIDHIKNKQVRSVGELIQLRFRSGLARIASLRHRALALEAEAEKVQLSTDFSLPTQDTDEIKKRIERLFREKSPYKKFAIRFNPGIIGTEIKKFFTTSEISQFFDQTNPISSITHKRRISVFGPNGLQRDHVNIAIRDIHPSQYGRICPIETAEGHNAGLVTSLALLGQIASLGWIEAPYFYAENSRVFASENPMFLSPQAESDLITCFASLATTINLEISAEYSSAKEDYLLSTMKSASINFVAVSPLQILSAATTLIPFLEHNDANRVLMGANMQRQAVPLLFPQKPIVGTGNEPVIAAHSSMVVKSFCSGFVLSANALKIIVQDIASAQKIYYPLHKNFRSNQETAINQKPAVWAGEAVAFNQILSDGPSVLDGELSLGQNLLAAYMPWEGYNYEDAIIISQRLLDQDCLTSVHIEEHTTELKRSIDPIYSEILTINVPQISSWLCRHLDPRKKIAKIGSHVKEYDVLVGKKVATDKRRSLTLASKGPEKSRENEPFFVMSTSKKKQLPFTEYVYQNISLCAPKGTDGKVVETRTINFDKLSQKKNASKLDRYKSGKLFCIFLAKARKAQVGDKLAGRHGNKGIISKILASRDMPHLPDGTPIDILLNPLGVPSRMNVGQVLEGLLGLAGSKLGCRFKIAPFDEGYGEEASRTLVNKKLKEAATLSKLNWIFNPSHLGKIFLKDGRTGEYFDNPITIGKSYILKLIHMAEDKIHARATGPYAKITEQPTAGKARGGGQRFGEMEAWALEAFGCSNILQELFTVKSDDHEGRNEMYAAISSIYSNVKPSPTVSETYLVLVRELNALGLEFLTRKTSGSFSSPQNNGCLNVDLFEALESRLRLREIIEKQRFFDYSKLKI